MLSAFTLGLSCGAGSSLELPAPRLVRCPAKDGRLLRSRLPLALPPNNNVPWCLLPTLAILAARSYLSLFLLDRELLRP